MYDLAEVAGATAALAAALAGAVTAAGWPARAAPTAFATHAELESHWLDPTVAVTHSCGLPVREALAGRVEALGTFVWREVSRTDGWYRTVVVVPAVGGAERPRDVRGSVPAVNHPQSLSGWASLGWALAGAGLTAADMGPALLTGGHAASLAALAAGTAGVASIDAVTWALLCRLRPALVARLRIVGHGPWVPATPLVTRIAPPVALARLRAALATAVVGPDLADVRATLGIEAFAPLTAADYGALDPIVAAAEMVLPRLGTHALRR